MKVLSIWDNRAAWFRAYAEEAFFEKGAKLPLLERRFLEEKERHMEACCKHVEICAIELREELKASQEQSFLSDKGSQP